MSMIKVSGVWKTYNLHKSVGIKELFVGRTRSDEHRFARKWALQDVSFEVSAGRSLGIVGHNGTGKSTLLSLLLGTIRADRGTIVRAGRTGAMLELGSGCHPELSGRENIFLNGSILGLHIREIKAKFDAIVQFSELGTAIDQPMRTYSAGMSARLAFSVLAHAHSDVLLIDEILAVGDASFQAKCSDFLKDYIASGGTLVVVSHNLHTLRELCVAGLWLHEGAIAEYGTIDCAIDRYRTWIDAQAGGTG